MQSCGYEPYVARPQAGRWRAKKGKNKQNLDLRQAAFASGPPPYYYQLLLLLNFVGLMGYGVFNRV